MRNKKIGDSYVLLINIVFFIFITLAGVLTVYFHGIYLMDFLKSANILLPLLLFFVTYSLSHLVRIFRLYAILVQNRSGFKQFIRIYLVTSWVNLIIPFKLGEIFRVSEFTKFSDSLKKSIVSIWIERFLDSIILCITILSVFILNKGSIQFLPLVLIVGLFISFSLFFFFEFPYTYKYLNTFLIKRVTTKKGIYLLKVVEFFKNIHENAKLLIRGKASILLFMTILIWMLELISIAVLFGSVNLNSILEKLVLLLNNVFLVQNIFGAISTYNILSIIVLTVFGFVVLPKIIYHRANEIKKYYKNKNLFNYKINNKRDLQDYGDDFYG